MADASPECKTCGTALNESNTYPSDWRRHVKICKDCKQKTFARLKERGSTANPPAETPVTPGLVTPPHASAAPESAIDPNGDRLTPDEVEMLHEVRIIRRGPTWKAMIQEGLAEIELTTTKSE